MLACGARTLWLHPSLEVLDFAMSSPARGVRHTPAHQQGVYVITQRGEDYFAGDLDAGDIEELNGNGGKAQS